MLISTLSYLEIRRRSSSQVQFGKGQFSMILHVILFLQKKILWNRFANCYFEEKRIVFHGDQNSFVIRHPSCLDEGNLKMSLFLVTKGSSISSLTCVFLFKGFVYLWGHWLSMSCVYGFLVIIGQFIRSRSDLVSALTCNTKNIIWIFGAKNKRCMMHFDAKWLSGSFAINRIFFSWKTNCALSLQKLTIFAPKLVNLHYSSLARKFKIPMRQIFMKIKFLQQQKWDFFRDFQTFWYRTSNEVNVAIYEWHFADELRIST